MDNLDYLYGDEEDRSPSRLSLVGIALGLVVCGVVLYKLAGPPHLPDALPDWSTIVTTLKGSDIPLEALTYIFTTLAWLVWGWVVASLVFQFLLAVAQVATHGAAWVRQLHVVVDPLTAPLVRRVVDGAVVAAVVVNLVGRTGTTAAAAPAEPTPIVLVAVARTDEGAPPPQAQDEADSDSVQYTVQPGDSLWAISERFYGTGEHFMRLVDANDGRAMPGGAHFTRAGVIHPGWVLVIPDPTLSPEEKTEEAVAATTYVVEPGDTLWGIAARFLGDPLRYKEVFELNRGVAHPNTGWRLTNPSLIWPGLQLKLPLPPQQSVKPPPARRVEKAAPPVAPPVAPPAAAQPQPSPTPVCPTPPPPAVPAAPLNSAPTVAPTPSPTRTVVVATPSDDAATAPISPWLLGAAGVGTAAAVGAAAFKARRRVRRSLSERPAPLEDEQPAPRGFADAEPARVLTHRLSGAEAEPAVVVAEQALRFLAENGVDEVTVVTAREGRGVVELTLSASLLVQARILELASDLATHLGGTVEASITRDQDVLLTLSGLKLATLLPPTTAGREPSRLFSLGVIPRRDILYANWRELGHVLVAGTPGSGADIVLTGVISALAARCSPDDLHLLTIASQRVLPAPLERLPHQLVGLVEPTDEESVAKALADARTEMTRRMERAATPTADGQSPKEQEPDVVLVIGELADLHDDDSTLETIATHGAAHGVYLLAATAQPEAIGDDEISLFGTRLALQTVDEEQSVRLLGQPDAVDLAHGEMIARLDGRFPVRLRGFRVSPEHLDQLLRVMVAEYEMKAPAAPRPLPQTTPEADAALDAEPTLIPAEPAEDEVEDAIDDAVPPELAPPEAQDGAEAEDTVSPEPSALVGPTVAEVIVEEKSAQLSLPAEAIGSVNGHVDQTGSDELAAPRRDETADLRDPQALVYLKCFGGFTVWAGDRQIEPVGEEGGVYKAWELLALLAAHPDGGLARERVIDAMWPDVVDIASGQRRAKAAVKRLRDVLMLYAPQLPRKAIIWGRDGQCALDPQFIPSDVHTFRTLCHAATHLPPQEAVTALRQAVALYQGSLLAGRQVPYYAWLHDRSETGLTLREQYREAARDARKHLARLYYQERQIDQAIAEYKTLLRGEPTLEEVVRGLFRCYHRLGDLTALLREDRQLRQALLDAYYDPDDPDDDPNEYQPEPETIALFNTLRQELEAQSAEGRPSINERLAHRKPRRRRK